MRGLPQPPTATHYSIGRHLAHGYAVAAGGLLVTTEVGT